MNLFLLVLLPFLAAPLAAWAGRLGRLGPAWVAAAVPMLGLALLSPLLAGAFRGEVARERVDWIPSLGLELVMRLDGLALLFVLLVLGIGALVVLYARYYLHRDDSMARFYASLLLFMGSMLGVVLSGNLLQLVVFWEATSISSFLLISYWQHRSDARRGARLALALTGAGGLALLGGVVMLGAIVGSHDLDVVLQSRDLIVAHPLYLPALVLILLGVFTKSAQFPFHFWLPHAMAAPTPVSAYLHSATMVKAGVFLLARLYPALSGTPEWSWLVGLTGFVTLILGAWIALFQHDLKGLLAYSTISHLGLITLLFGLSTPLAAVAGVFHIINHAIFKASLFMAAGIIDHECGTRDMRRINGLLRYMPHTAVLAMVATAAMAGVPLANGFLSKEMFFDEAALLYREGGGFWLPALATLAGMFSVAYSIRFIHDVFFNGEPVDLPRTPHEPPRWMKVPVEMLVVLCLAVGIVPALTVAPVLGVAAGAVLGGPPPAYSLAIWHGFTPALYMSLVAMAGGGLIYLFRKPLFSLYDLWAERVDGRVFWEYVEVRARGLARWLVWRMEGGGLQQIVAWTVAIAVAVAAQGFLSSGAALTGDRPGLPADAMAVAGALIIMVAALATVLWQRQRLLALLTSGVVGLMVSVAFVIFSAPDLALTQISVEVVTVVLLLLALYFLPQQPPRESTPLRRWGDAGLALLAGGGAAALAWAMLTRPFDSLSGYFLEHSVPGGGGTNVVNVILVDFRGFDTLGEITVLALAALGIFAMLAGLGLPGPDRDEQGRPWSTERFPVIMSSLSRLLLPLLLLVAVFIFLRGHNLPGGGFIAGLVAAVALVLQYLAHGVAWTRARMPRRLRAMIGAGLLIATGTGLGSWLYGRPFLTTAHGHVHLPLVGELHLATAALFDLGVFLVVVGSVVLALVRLGELSRAGKGGGTAS